MTIRHLLLTTLIAMAPCLASTASAKPDRPVKTVRECNEELRLNADKLEKAGVSATEFFHNCWWNSKPGEPTPIAHATRQPDRPANTASAIVPQRDVSPAGPEPYHAPTPTEAGIKPQPVPDMVKSDPTTTRQSEPAPASEATAPAPVSAPTPAAERAAPIVRKRASRRTAFARSSRYSRYRYRDERAEDDGSQPFRRRARVDAYVAEPPPLPRPGPPQINILEIPDVAANIASRALAGQPIPAPEVSAVVRGIVNPQIPPGILPPPF